MLLQSAACCLETKCSIGKHETRKLKQLRTFDHYFCENVLNAPKEIVVLGSTCTPLMCNTV